MIKTTARHVDNPGLIHFNLVRVEVPKILKEFLGPAGPSNAIH